METLSRLETFQREVAANYHIYNSVFITLPFDAIDNTGALLPLFAEVCQQGFDAQWTPDQTIQQFHQRYVSHLSDKELHDLLFRLIQYVERQVVLFDAIEDAAFAKINPVEGRGSLRELIERAEAKGKKEALVAFLSQFKVRPVLTAHPTQFYPGPVLGIITDLTQAIRDQDLLRIKQLLAQLGKTPFIKKQKPTPYDEASSLMWYLEHVFYQTVGDMAGYLQKHLGVAMGSGQALVQLGFWPGGDRDGNPYVTPDISLQVADRLRLTLLRCYYQDVRQLKRKLTFKGVDRWVTDIEARLYATLFRDGASEVFDLDFFKQALQHMAQILQQQHQSLYLDEVQALQHKVQVFGLHFAALDIRQNSHIHQQVLEELCQVIPGCPNAGPAAIEWLLQQPLEVSPLSLSPLAQDTLGAILAMQTIQRRNGEAGCNRYIISNNGTAADVLLPLALFGVVGWKAPEVDFVPLFESVDDLQQAALVMQQLYTHTEYAAHLKRRKRRQTVMLGFSDGTKDGGYLMANWSIFKAKEAITAVSRQYDVEVVFFDGRGGPPARGGGKTHKFYASLGTTIENCEIQLTVQGQTISSNFGTRDSCRWNLENLISAGAQNEIFSKEKNNLTPEEHTTLDDLAQHSYEAYLQLKARPEFIPYLEHMSTLPYYALTNIGSRPAKRNAGSALEFSQLRAIPFVGSWSQLKQNVPGFYGVGSALQAFERQGRWHEVKALYDRSLFFRTLLENSMMALAKSFMPLTAYMQRDPEFGAFWNLIFHEYTITRDLLLRLAGHQSLMENYPDGQASIALREQLVKPLLAIQQYALYQLAAIRRGQCNAQYEAVYRKLVTRALFGNTNAARNSA